MLSTLPVVLAFFIKVFLCGVDSKVTEKIGSIITSSQNYRAASTAHHSFVSFLVQNSQAAEYASAVFLH